MSISRACAPGRSRESGADRDGQGLVLFCVLRLIEKQSQRRKKKTGEDFSSPSVFCACGRCNFASRILDRAVHALDPNARESMERNPELAVLGMEREKSSRCGAWGRE